MDADDNKRSSRSTSEKIYFMRTKLLITMKFQLYTLIYLIIWADIIEVKNRNFVGNIFTNYFY